MGCIVYSPYWFRTVILFVVIGGIIYLHQRGAFGVARFDWQGNAKAFTLWDE